MGGNDRKVLEVSRCSRARQRQRNVQKVCSTCKVAFLLIRPIVVFSLFSFPSPLSITRLYILFEQTINMVNLLGFVKSSRTLGQVLEEQASVSDCGKQKKLPVQRNTAASKIDNDVISCYDDSDLNMIAIAVVIIFPCICKWRRS